MESSEGGGSRFSRKRLILGGAVVGAAAAAAIEGFKKITESKPAKLPEGIEELRINGIQVLVSGKEGGPNLLFFHNAGQVPEGMTEHILNLAPHGRVIAPNSFDAIRYLQLNGNPNPSFADVANVISNLGVIDKKQKTGVVSSSFGSSFAWEYSVQNPEEVAWNVAGSPTGWPLKRSLIGWMGAFAREFIAPPEVPIPDKLKKRDPGLKFWGKRLLQHPSSLWHGLKLTMNADQKETMEKINTPVDLLWGRTDKYIPPWSTDMVADAFPTNARVNLTYVSPYNHLWMAVQPEQLTDPAVNRARAMPPVPRPAA